VPGYEWKLIFALARYAGLRTPSGSRLLTWNDIQWHENKMMVSSPKTEHHEGRAKRVVPIVPELLPYSLEALDRAPEGTTHVISLHRGERTSARPPRRS
jgi:hypothetical protein